MKWVEAVRIVRGCGGSIEDFFDNAEPLADDKTTVEECARALFLAAERAAGSDFSDEDIAYLWDTDLSDDDRGADREATRAVLAKLDEIVRRRG